MFKPWNTHRYPELTACPTEAERVEVLKHCTRLAQTKVILRQLLLVLPVTIVTAIALLWYWTEVFGILPPRIAVFAVFGLSSSIGGALTFRRNERYLVSIIRRELVGRGYPLCLHRGYNLTGNTSGVCPECGTPAVAAAEKSGR